MNDLENDDTNIAPEPDTGTVAEPVADGDGPTDSGPATTEADEPGIEPGGGETGESGPSEEGGEQDRPGPRERPAFMPVVDVRHARGCRRLTVRAGKFKNLDVGRAVITESDVGPTLGMIVSPLREVPSAEAPGRRIIRMASDHDFCQDAENKDFEDEARQYCIERIQSRELPMHLVSAEVSLDRRKLIFFFTAEGRIDFRDLVKDLASQFRTRIEMRQIGSRDETKLIGGLGPCGQEVCCHRWLNQFVPISIKMAKQQDLSLNPTKISGLCGRLMCCLVYEYDPKAKGRKKRSPVQEPPTRPEREIREVPAETPVEEPVEAAAAPPAPEPGTKPDEGQPKGKRKRRRRKKPSQVEGAAAPREDAGPRQEAAPAPQQLTDDAAQKKSRRRRGRRRRGKKKDGGGRTDAPGQKPAGSDRPSGGDS